MKEIVSNKTRYVFDVIDMLLIFSMRYLSTEFFSQNEKDSPRDGEGVELAAGLREGQRCSPCGVGPEGLHS